MAFSDIDIHNHIRSLGLNRPSIANYGKVGIPSPEDRTVGKVPHFAELKAKNQDIYTLKSTRERENGSLMKPLHWARTWESK